MKLFIYFSLFIFLLSQVNIFSQYPNILVDNTNSPEEVTIAINPVNPNILAAGANIDQFYRSTNGGLNWSESQLVSNNLGVWGDPVVLFDSSGILYYAHLSNPISGWWIDRIVVQRSTNNGISWNDGVGIYQGVQPQAQDKEWLAVDHSRSPYRGTIYATWTEFDSYGSSNPADSSRIRFSKSTNQGLTWSPAKVINDVSGNCIDSDNTTEGAVPAVGPNGEIYVAWAGPVGIVLDKSTDGGQTWGQDIFVSDMPGGWDFDVSGIYRANGLPITMCDISNSPYRGYVYVVWSDQRNGATNTDIFIAKSTNGGTTWSAPVRVNDDNTTRHQFFVWSTIDPSTGHLWFVFYDRRNTTGAATDVFVAKSTDGGTTFENFKVSETSFTPTASIFFGDYSNIAAWNGKIYPMWMRLQSNQLSVWVSIIEDSIIVPVELNNFAASVNDGKVSLTWETSSELNNLGFYVERRNISSDENETEWLEIGFKEGRGNSTERNFYQFEDLPLYNGTYHYRLRQVDFNGSYTYSNEVEVNLFTIKTFELSQNYPNPFNPTTTISFQLPEASFISLKVFDALGTEVETIAEGKYPAGVHEVNFDAKDLSSGLYMYRIISGNNEITRKMIVVK
ncbi:MAG: T9SS type A sorting domain-containing protein [Ignavibacteriaceae bacterium]|nr:T9SS type A sorting domain-containing protein [Ignavibacteriaceae bacterium]